MTYKYHVTETKNGISTTTGYNDFLSYAIIGGVKKAVAQREDEIARAIAEGKTPPKPINATQVYMKILGFIVIIGICIFMCECLSK